MTADKRWKSFWDRKEDALAYFRAIWRREAEAGRAPGEPITDRIADQMLRWLAEPELRGVVIDHFTTELDGRGNRRFVAVDLQGVPHPFSTNGALTCAEAPPREPFDPANPFKGLTS